MEHLEIVSGPTVTQSGTLAMGSPVVTGLTTAALQGAVFVSGSGIPVGTLVKSIDSLSQVTLSTNATAAGSASLEFRLEAVTLAEAKLHLKQDGIDDDDTLIIRLISAARLEAEVRLKQTILATTYDMFLDGFPGSGGGYFYRQVRQSGPGPNWLPRSSDAVINLLKPPLVSVESVKYLDSNGVEQTIDPSKYRVSTGFGSRIQPTLGQCWPVIPAQVDGVVIRYTAGRPTAAQVDDNIKAAILLTVGTFYEFRESVLAGTIVAQVPRTVDDLLAASAHGGYS